MHTWNRQEITCQGEHVFHIRSLFNGLHLDNYSYFNYFEIIKDINKLFGNTHNVKCCEHMNVDTFEIFSYLFQIMLDDILIESCYLPL